MRKLLAVLLAVMMLASVLAILPASAATYDGSTAASVGKPELIITEMAQNSGENGSTGFIEVLNNTTADVDFSTLSLLRALNFNQGLDEYDLLYPYVESWVSDKLFLQKMDMVSGEIVKNPTDYAIFDGDSMTKVRESLENSADDLTVATGETAIIWFVTEKTAEWLGQKRSANISAYEPREIFIKTYLGTDAQASDYNIIMVWAPSNMTANDELATDMFTWDIPGTTEYNKSVIIALAENTWDLANDNCKGAVNSKIKSMVVIGNLVADYVATSANASAVFAPATTKPLLKNEKNKVIGNDTVYNDYVEAGYSTSYLEVGAVLWGTAQTPGSLPDWQYAMIKDALNVATPAGLDVTAVLNAFFVSEGLGELEAGREETKKDHNYVDRNELEQLFSGANKDDEEGGNLVLILIIVGAVVLVLAAVAVVLFVVILPKKKKAAAAAASEEAPVEAPAEEAPVEAPVEEKTEE